MELDIASDLINNSQILFRQLAGLQSYNPNFNFQSPASIESLVSTLDQSPKCNSCQGNLLRGFNSLICIYCGQYLKNNNDSISFNSTHAFTWLLQSLNFNGSERVGSLVEGSGINGGQSPAEDESTLSELLNLKISWPKKPDNKVSKRSSFVNLGTADVDNFFIESKRATVSNVVPEEIDQNKAFDDDSSGWNAEFQSADTEIVNETFKSVDSYVGAEVDLSSQMDSVFGQMESFNKKKPNDDSDLFSSDDPFANMRSEKFQLAEPLDSVVQANDGLSGHLNSHSLKSADVVFGQMESFNNRKPNDDLDLFSSDDPFANMSSKSFQQAQSSDSVQANDGLSGHLNRQNPKSVDAVFGKMESVNNRKVNDDLDLFSSDDPFANMGSESFQQAQPSDSVQANEGLSGHLNSQNPKSVDAVFGQMESVNNRKVNDDLDLFSSDDPFANMGSESFQQAQPSDSVQANEGLSGHLNSQNPKSVDAVFGQMESVNNRNVNDDLDLFSSDDPFANMGSESFQQAQPSDLVQANEGLSGHLNSQNPKSVDAVFGQMESVNNRNVNDDLDLFSSDDPFANMGSESFQQAQPSDSVQANEGLSVYLNDPDTKSVDADFGQIESFSNKKPNDDLNLFSSDDPFANVGAESFQQAKPLDSVVQANDSLPGQRNDLNSRSVDQDWFNDDNWQKSGPNINNAPSTEGVSVDWFENTSWPKSDAENTATVKDNNLFDIKPLIGSDPDNLNKISAKDTSEATDWFQDGQWSIAASKNNDDDGFDEWNDFTSSTGNQDPFPDSRKESSTEKIAVNVPSTAADPHEVDFSNFFQSADLFSGPSSNKKPNDNQTEYDIFSEVSTASRNANAEAGNSPERLKNEEIAPNTTTSSKDDIQMLMSQMHDLSFMLKSELSIPSKTDINDL